MQVVLFNVLNKLFGSARSSYMEISYLVFNIHDIAVRVSIVFVHYVLVL